MHVLLCFATAATLALAACQPRSGPVPGATTQVEVGPDSLFAATRARLAELGYRMDQVDAAGRRLVVRPPDSEGQVVVRIEGRGSASRVSTAPAGGGDLAAQMLAVLTVMHDVAIEPAGQRGEPAGAEGGLPDSRWITEFFLSPRGRLWSARGGLFSADSLFGRWGRSFGAPTDPVNADNIRVGTSLGFVNEQVMLLGVDGPGWRNTPVLYRTVDGGASWAIVPGLLFEQVEAIAAESSSVWAFASEVTGEDHQTVFLRSADGGERWERAPLPAGIRYVRHAYRVTADTAYVAMAGFDRGPVLWRTTDGGTRWEPLPTPHDQRVHRVPEHGSRIEEIAIVGNQLVVVEYGRAFSTRTDSIRWRAMNGIRHVAADRAADRLFALTSRLEPVMMDSSFTVVWRGDQRIPDHGTSNSVTGVAAHDGVAYVSMQQGELYEVRGGRVRLRRPER